MTTTTKILTGVIIILLLVIGYYFFFAIPAKNNHIADLEKENQRLIVQERIDSQTIGKLGTMVDDLSKHINNEKVTKLIKEREQTPTSVTTIKYRVGFKDTLRIIADTVYKIVYKDKVVEYGQKIINDKWYYMDMRWSCNPYEAEINKLTFYDKIGITTFQDEEQFGVYAYSENPHSVLDTVTYFVAKQKPSKFNFGVGLGTNTNVDLTAIGEIEYGHHAIWGTFNLSDKNERNIFQKKVNADDWRVGYMYKFR